MLIRSQEICLRTQITALAGDRTVGDLGVMSIEELLELFKQLLDEENGGPQVHLPDDSKLLAEMEVCGSLT